MMGKTYQSIISLQTYLQIQSEFTSGRAELLKKVIKNKILRIYEKGSQENNWNKREWYWYTPMVLTNMTSCITMNDLHSNLLSLEPYLKQSGITNTKREHQDNITMGTFQDNTDAL